MPNKYLFLLITFFICVSSAKLFAQESQPKKQYSEVVIEHKTTGSAIVKANAPRPLHDVISALNDEYGWTINYEDAPYDSDFELIDSTDPKWRASHPNAPGFKIPAGDFFQCEYEEGTTLTTSAGKEEVLRKIVSEYNPSGNPGKFIVLAEEEGRFSVIGTKVKGADTNDKEVFPILDTLISIPTEKRSADETIEIILKALSEKSGMKVANFGIADNLLMQSKVTVGGENTSARNLLLKTLNATKRTYIWSLLYDANQDTFYALNTRIAARVERKKDGTKSLKPIDRLPFVNDRRK